MREETKGTQGVALGYEQHWAFTVISAASQQFKQA
mgnify:FL=1